MTSSGSANFASLEFRGKGGGGDLVDLATRPAAGFYHFLAYFKCVHSNTEGLQEKFCTTNQTWQSCLIMAGQL